MVQPDRPGQVVPDRVIGIQAGDKLSVLTRIHLAESDVLQDHPSGALNRPLTGVFLGAEIATPRAQAMIGELVEDVAAGRLEVLIDRTFPLADAAAAHAFIESRQAVGRVVLIP